MIPSGRTLHGGWAHLRAREVPKRPAFASQRTCSMWCKGSATSTTQSKETCISLWLSVLTVL
jgi:hypothetical protein